ncbi:hypothetical protein R69919_03218 [Paraburkholderia gardini]|nr:hypothetical protein R69919_03218 [Paraburkholderia gardini]
MRPDLVLYAPNVHTGGGYVLLRALLAAWPAEQSLRAFLDIRARKRLTLPAMADVTWVEPRLTSRLRAEFMVRDAVDKDTRLFCFHGLPPLLTSRAEVIVLIQNRLLIGSVSLAGYPLKVRLRILVERRWSSMLQHRCSRYIVQTPSMAASLKRWLRYDVPVSVVPFTSDDHSYTSASDDRKSKFDFVYVASGESHKNHRNLLDAWRLLAEAGLRPSLTLTVDSSTYRDLSDRISWHIVQLGLNIVNVGPLQQSDIADLYRSSSALIFPSIIESFGLPLIEATRLGLPVIAAELDYVRDIVRPVETFDPHSPVSIARAVRRFMNVPDDLIEIHSPKQFLEEILR